MRSPRCGNSPDYSLRLAALPKVASFNVFGVATPGLLAIGKALTLRKVIGSALQSRRAAREMVGLAVGSSGLHSFADCLALINLIRFTEKRRPQRMIMIVLEVSGAFTISMDSESFLAGGRSWDTGVALVQKDAVSHMRTRNQACLPDTQSFRGRAQVGRCKAHSAMANCMMLRRSLNNLMVVLAATASVLAACLAAMLLNSRRQLALAREVLATLDGSRELLIESIELTPACFCLCG